MNNLPSETPWGTPDHITRRAAGIFFISTPSHGGFWISPERNGHIPQPLRNDSGFYEEDCEWCAVAYTFPELFDHDERQSAIKTMINWFPAAYEAITNTAIPAGKSYIKDKEAFAARHAHDWVVISAIASKHHPGYVECLATIGGKRDAPLRQQRRFLVLSDEHRTASHFGFVIDPARHNPYVGPSSFRGWGFA